MPESPIRKKIVEYLIETMQSERNIERLGDAVKHMHEDVKKGAVKTEDSARKAASSVETIAKKHGNVIGKLAGQTATQMQSLGQKIQTLQSSLKDAGSFLLPGRITDSLEKELSQRKRDLADLQKQFQALGKASGLERAVRGATPFGKEFDFASQEQAVAFQKNLVARMEELRRQGNQRGLSDTERVEMEKLAVVKRSVDAILGVEGKRAVGQSALQQALLRMEIRSVEARQDGIAAKMRGEQALSEFVETAAVERVKAEEAEADARVQLARRTTKAIADANRQLTVSTVNMAEMRFRAEQEAINVRQMAFARGVAGAISGNQPFSTRMPTVARGQADLAKEVHGQLAVAARMSGAAQLNEWRRLATEFSKLEQRKLEAGQTANALIVAAAKEAAEKRTVIARDTTKRIIQENLRQGQARLDARRQEILERISQRPGGATKSEIKQLDEIRTKKERLTSVNTRLEQSYNRLGMAQRGAVRSGGDFAGSMRGVMRATDSARFMTFQLTSAVQDAAIGFGMAGFGAEGMALAFRGASNNLGVLAASAGTSVAILGTIPLIGIAIAEAMHRANKESEELGESITKTADRFGELAQSVVAARDAYKDLASARRDAMEATLTSGEREGLRGAREIGREVAAELVTKTMGEDFVDKEVSRREKRLEELVALEKTNPEQFARVAARPEFAAVAQAAEARIRARELDRGRTAAMEEAGLKTLERGFVDVWTRGDTDIAEAFREQIEKQGIAGTMDAARRAVNARSVTERAERLLEFGGGRESGRFMDPTLFAEVLTNLEKVMRKSGEEFDRENKTRKANVDAVLAETNLRKDAFARFKELMEQGNIKEIAKVLEMPELVSQFEKKRAAKLEAEDVRVLKERAETVKIEELKARQSSIRKTFEDARLRRGGLGEVTPEIVSMVPELRGREGRGISGDVKMRFDAGMKRQMSAIDKQVKDAEEARKSRIERERAAKDAEQRSRVREAAADPLAGGAGVPTSGAVASVTGGLGGVARSATRAAAALDRIAGVGVGRFAGGTVPVMRLSTGSGFGGGIAGMAAGMMAQSMPTAVGGAMPPTADELNSFLASTGFGVGGGAETPSQFIERTDGVSVGAVGRGSGEAAGMVGPRKPMGIRVGPRMVGPRRPGVRLGTTGSGGIAGTARIFGAEGGVVRFAGETHRLTDPSDVSTMQPLPKKRQPSAPFLRGPQGTFVQGLDGAIKRLDEASGKLSEVAGTLGGAGEQLTKGVEEQKRFKLTDNPLLTGGAAALGGTLF